MAKVSRKKLARGVELTVNHVFDPIDDMRRELDTANIQEEQLDANNGTFRLNFNIPWLDSKYFYDNRTSGVTATVKTPGDTYTANTVYTVTGGAGAGMLVRVDEVDPAGGADSVVTFTITNPGNGSYVTGNDVTLVNPLATTPAVLTLDVSPDNYDGPFYIPFCLPPLQDEFAGTTTTPLMASETPFPVLEEVSFSLDQSDEPAAILGQWYGREDYKYGPPRHWVPNPHAGKKTYTRTDAYDFTLSIYEKEQEFFNTSVQDSRSLSPGGEAVSLNIPASAFISRSTRFNPIAVGDINREFHPLKTYMLAIYAPNLHDQSTSREHCVALNVWVSLKFKRKLVTRDSTTGAAPQNLQNVPLHYGQKTGPTVTVTQPVAGSTIVADGLAAGVSTNLQHIDQQFSDKLRGGYNEFAQTYPTQPLADDAGYEVIAVPMGGGFPHNRMSARDEYPLAPYTSGALFQPGTPPAHAEEPYIDRRLIPIDGEMTVHHVIVALNWTSDKMPLSYDPAAATPGDDAPIYVPSGLPLKTPGPGVKYSVGVGMLVGPRADHFDYEQIAFSEFTPEAFATPPDGLIDAIALGLPACNADGAFEWELISVPIVNQAAAPAAYAGKGYWGFEGGVGGTWSRGQQGAPYFVGPGNTYTSGRTNVGTAPGAVAPFGGGNNSGTEQFLEVRLSVDPQDFVYQLTGADLVFQTANYDPVDIFLGYGGCWVYIIGKKHLK